MEPIGVNIKQEYEELKVQYEILEYEQDQFMNDILIGLLFNKLLKVTTENYHDKGFIYYLRNNGIVTAIRMKWYHRKFLKLALDILELKEDWGLYYDITTTGKKY